MNGVRLLWLVVRLGVLHEAAHRANFLAQVMSSAVGLGTSLTFMAVLYSHTDSLAGWRPPELLALWGAFFVLTGLLGTFVQPSLRRFVDDVRDGTLDFTLTKPVDSQAFVSVRQVEVWKLVDTTLGLGLLGVALVQLGERTGPGPVAAFAVALAAGGAIAYGMCLMLATLAFWLTRMEDVLILFLSLWETGRWPIDIYPAWLRGMLTFVIPVALATSVPVGALIGRASPTTLAAVVVLAIATLGISRWLWLRGLRHYTGASA